jgi:hypothetical protein
MDMEVECVVENSGVRCELFLDATNQILLFQPSRTPNRGKVFSRFSREV